MQFDNVEEAIAMSAMYAANHLKGVTAIIAMTESGRTALMTSRISSGLPIFAMSRHERTLNLTSCTAALLRFTLTAKPTVWLPPAKR